MLLLVSEDVSVTRVMRKYPVSLPPLAAVEEVFSADAPGGRTGEG